jgi:hypothetical protein
MAYDTDYGVCKYCGAKRVQNPKTGKIFCSGKCWLKKSPDAPQSPTSTTRPQYGQLPVQQNIEALEAKINALTQRLNNMQFAVHSLWAILISGDSEKERLYEMHKEPTLAQSKIVEPTEEELGF